MIYGDLMESTWEASWLDGWMENPINGIWLVVFRHPSEKYEFVNWDD